MIRAAAAALFLAGAAVLFEANRRRAAYARGSVDAGDQPEGVQVGPVEVVDPAEVPSIADTALDVVRGAGWGMVDRVTGPSEAQRSANVRAFLAMIRAAEGTAPSGGYGALFGWPAAGRSFDASTAVDHPRRFFSFTDRAGRTLRTSAAGAYQVTVTTWDDAGSGQRIRRERGINGFRPADQDAFAVGLLALDGALPHVEAGRFDEAVRIARRRWASLPGAGYDQPERGRDWVLARFIEAGGVVA